MSRMEKEIKKITASVEVLAAGWPFYGLMLAPFLSGLLPLEGCSETFG